jgi:hypothetical protein
MGMAAEFVARGRAGELWRRGLALGQQQTCVAMSSRRLQRKLSRIDR